VNAAKHAFYRRENRMKQQDAQMDDAHADEAPRGDPHFCATEGCKGLAAMTYLCRECWEAQCGEEENSESAEGSGDACHPTEEREPTAEENDEMSKKKSTKSKATKKSAKGGTKVQPVATKRQPVGTEAKVDRKTTPKAKKATENKPKRVSALDAAAQVLKAAGKPMRAQDLITAMAEQGLWSSPNGKTPHATLYAALMRESRDKGKASRFSKVDRGMFEYHAPANA